MRFRVQRHHPSITLIAAGLVAASLPAVPPAAAAVQAPAGWQLRWAPSAGRDGMAGFEHSEDDRANSHPAASPHIKVQGNNYRFDMHMVDVDTATDRQRQEVRGMRTGGRTVSMLRGERWRFTYSMFIPGTHQATTTFNHIMQTKMPGTGTGPITVMSLRRHAGVPKLEFRVFETNLLVGAVDLAPLQNRWVRVELELGIGDAPDGWVRWVIRNGRTKVIDATALGVDLWLGDRVRPKWGIYRSLRDASGSLRDTYMLITDLRAYQWSEVVQPPAPVRYEAERAAFAGGVVDATYGGHSGTGYVDLADAAGGYVEWTVHSARASDTVLNFWYANATPVPRPLDITVNGVRVSAGLVFERTPAWNDWETRTIIVPLRAGANTVRASAGTAVGGPNLDAVEVQPLPGPVERGVGELRTGSVRSSRRLGR